MARAEKVRLPNPAKGGKVRLDARPARVHKSKKAYSRRPKHQAKESVQE